MKNKRILALLLALALALSLALPAAAVEPLDLISRPPGTLYVKRGESFTLTVEVDIPEGVDEVTYQWYYFGSVKVAGATSNTLLLSPGDEEYPKNHVYYSVTGATSERYTCRIAAIDSESGKEYGRWVSDITVHVEGSFWAKLYSITLEPLVEAFNDIFDAFPLGLIYFPFTLIRGYVNNFKGLFLF